MGQLVPPNLKELSRQLLAISSRFPRRVVQETDPVGRTIPSISSALHERTVRSLEQDVKIFGLACQALSKAVAAARLRLTR